MGQAPGQPNHRTFAVHCLDVAAREPQLAGEDVEELVLRFVPVQRRPEVSRGEELHSREYAVRLLAVDLGGVERAQEMEALTLVTGNQNWTLH